MVPLQEQVNIMIKRIVFLLLIAGICCLTGLSLAAKKVSSDSKQPFSFAWVSDTHIVTTDTTLKYGDRVPRLKAALADIARHPEVDFIVHSGDMIDNTADPNQYAVFKQVMTPSLPWYPISGNHDISNNPEMKHIDLYLQQGFGRGEKQLEYYGFVHKSAAFFVLNTFAYNSKDSTELLRADDQLKEMDSFFSKHKDFPYKIVCGHAPIFIKSSNEADEYFNIKKSYRTRIIQLMQKYGIKYYLCGHRHGNHIATDTARTGITVYTQTSLAWPIGKGQQAGYSIFSISSQGLQKQFIPIEIGKIE